MHAHIVSGWDKSISPSSNFQCFQNPRETHNQKRKVVLVTFIKGIVMAVTQFKRGKKPQFSQKQVDRMKHMREEGLRNEDIARVMGASKTTIADYITGKRKVRV